MPTALVRSVPDSFSRAIVGDRGRAPDVALAREQHARYRALLAGAGYDVVTLDGDEGFPDCVFVEDTAVILGSVAVATRPGAAARRGEADAVGELLSQRCPLERIEPPGTLDGGDVMILGDTVWAGLSARTNRGGLAQLDGIAAGQGMRTIEVPVTGVLHLKSAVLPVSEDTVVVTPGTVDESLLTGLRVIHEAEDERHGFSALPLEDGTVLVTESAPRTGESVARTGLPLIPIDISEFQAADGGLTCMSILF